MLVLVIGGCLRHGSSVSPTGSPVPAGCGLVTFHDPVHGSRADGTVTARRAELDELEEHLVKQLAEVRAERDELAVAERVLERVSEQLAAERASAARRPGRWAARR
ncbi:hypothetical protein [Streptomyces sp. NPDC017890]|uniref:hypothetical protein n=1 Tax=Streptomyces sp. NPDC017890 TaxID=3365015 RepID=UPI0037B68668